MALWLQAEGFRSVVVLAGGLAAWQEAGYPTVSLNQEQPPAPQSAGVSAPSPAVQTPGHAHTFLPGLAQSYLSQSNAPIRKELTVVFVDIANSTSTIVNQPPERALDLVQGFMAMVTEIALENCGDVKDYEGDGALLYFESVTEAVQAALAIRKALSNSRPENGQPALQARISLNLGDIIIGVIGVAMRRSVALIGPSINLASRLLKHIPPGGIIATQAALERLAHETPTLAEQFQPLEQRLELKGFENEYATTFHIP